MNYGPPFMITVNFEVTKIFNISSCGLVVYNRPSVPSRSSAVTPQEVSYLKTYLQMEEHNQYRYQHYLTQKSDRLTSTFMTKTQNRTDRGKINVQNFGEVQEKRTYEPVLPCLECVRVYRRPQTSHTASQLVLTTD